MTWTRLLGLGEAMVRLTSPPGTPLPVARQLGVSVGGAELNALVAARMADMPATWVTALPTGPLADLVVRQVAGSRVDLQLTRSTGNRLGLYFLESHAAPRPSQVTYDRAASAFALLDPTSLDWTSLLDADTCLVLSGITPALGQGPRTAMTDAVQAAVDVGATVAFDVNFRPSLWSAEDCYGLVSDLLPHIDVLAASDHDLRALGIDSADPQRTAVEAFGLLAVIGTSKAYRDGAVEIRVVATDADDQVHVQQQTTVIDAVGAGDALFGTFLATVSERGLRAATAQALGAAISVYGTDGDLMVTPVWDGDGPAGGVKR